MKLQNVLFLTIRTMISTVPLVFAVIACVNFMDASPITRTSDVPWSRPCHPSPSRSHSNQGGFIAVTHSHSDTMATLSMLTSEAHDIAETLKEHVFHNRLDGSLRTAEALSIPHITPFPLPKDVISWSDAGQTGDVLRTNYRHLSILLAFLEVIREDCRVHGRTDGVLEHVQNLETKVFEVLCHLQSLMRSFDLSVEEHVSRDEIPQQFREITIRAFVNQRDYIIVKDAVHLLQAIKDTHFLMHEG